MGTTSPYQTVPADRARSVLLGMRDAGMVWDGMQALVGADRRDLQRIAAAGPDGRVTRRMEALIVAAGRRLEERPDLVDMGRHLFAEGPRVRWMIDCLQARGWTSEWIGREVGWTRGLSSSVVSYDTVTVDLLARVEGVFKASHTSWGPSRLGAVRAWRSGKFPSDCYDMDADPSVRYVPVPGSLHPDLVVEACTFGPKQAHRRSQMVSSMRRRWGQWGRESCASAAVLAWRAALGEAVEPVPGEAVCAVKSHRHEVLPEVWLPLVT